MAALEKEKDKFVNAMQQEQSEFDLKVNDISSKVTSFTQYQDITAFEEVATAAKEVW